MAISDPLEPDDHVIWIDPRSGSQKRGIVISLPDNPSLPYGLYEVRIGKWTILVPRSELRRARQEVTV